MPDPATDSPASESVTLNCLEGRPAPPVVMEGWKQLMTFPPQAWEAYWRLLLSALTTPENPAHQNLIGIFCKEFKIVPEAMLLSLGCGELLLRQAAVMNLAAVRFEEDLAALTAGGSDQLLRFMAPRYPEANQLLRNQILLDSLATHGKVMTGLNWRLDKVQHSSHGNHLNTDIILLTIDYREGKTQGAVTLQLTRDAARQLRRFCARIDDGQEIPAGS